MKRKIKHCMPCLARNATKHIFFYLISTLLHFFFFFFRLTYLSEIQIFTMCVLFALCESVIVNNIHTKTKSTWNVDMIIIHNFIFTLILILCFIVADSFIHTHTPSVKYTPMSCVQNTLCLGIPKHTVGHIAIWHVCLLFLLV